MLYTLPTSPYNYACVNRVWYVTADDGYNNIIFRFILKKFSLVTNRDYLNFGIGHDISARATMVSRLTGQQTLRTLKVNSSTAWVEFITPNDLSLGWWGFAVKVYAINDTQGMFDLGGGGRHTHG